MAATTIAQVQRVAVRWQCAAATPATSEHSRAVLDLVLLRVDQNTQASDHQPVLLELV